MKQQAAFLKKMKETLLAKREELHALIRKMSAEGTPEREVRDSADEAHSSSMSKLQSSLEKSEIAEIKLIEDALARIERGEYGICIDCSEPISTKRLEIFPYAARCISCQESQES